MSRTDIVDKSNADPMKSLKKGDKIRRIGNSYNNCQKWGVYTFDRYAGDFELVLSELPGFWETKEFQSGGYLVEDTPTIERKFKSGDVVRVIGNDSLHKIPINALVTLKDHHRHVGRSWWNTDFGTCGDVYESDIEPFVPPEVITPKVKQTPFEARGWTKEDKFLYKKGVYFLKNEILTLDRDNGTSTPSFTNGRTGYYINLNDIEKVETSDIVKPEDIKVSVGHRITSGFIDASQIVSINNLTNNNVGETKMGNRRVVTIRLLDNDKGLDVEHSLVASFTDVVTEDDNETTIRELLNSGEVAGHIEAHNKIRQEQVDKDILKRTGAKVNLEPVKLKNLDWVVV